jgi:hypothetical protein
MTERVLTEDRNCLSFWFPRLAGSHLPLPPTQVITSDADLTCVLDGETPEGWDEFIADVRAAGDRVGWPCFLRTGHISGKHEWERTCYVPGPGALEQHVAGLVEWSHMVDMMGLPTRVWAIRKLLETRPLFTCAGYGNFPVTREFRFFVRDGAVEHWQPYWPPDAVEVGRPDDPGWREKLDKASRLTGIEYEELAEISLDAVALVGGGYWSVDLLEDARGNWYLTDMAEGDRSFMWTRP